MKASLENIDLCFLLKKESNTNFEILSFEKNIKEKTKEILSLKNKGCIQEIFYRLIKEDLDLFKFSLGRNLWDIEKIYFVQETIRWWRKNSLEAEHKRLFWKSEIDEKTWKEISREWELEEVLNWFRKNHIVNMFEEISDTYHATGKTSIWFPQEDHRLPYGWKISGIYY